MIAAAGLFQGERDFTAFAASDNRDEEGRSKVRTIFNSTMARSADHLIYTVRGSGFLKHMVRNIVGTLIETGRGNLDAAGIAVLFSADARRKAGPTAPAKGLVLLSVEYPDYRSSA